MGQEHLSLYRSGERISFDLSLYRFLHEMEIPASKTEPIRGTAKIWQAGARHNKTQLLHEKINIVVLAYLHDYSYATA